MSATFCKLILVYRDTICFKLLFHAKSVLTLQQCCYTMQRFLSAGLKILYLVMRCLYIMLLQYTGRATRTGVLNFCWQCCSNTKEATCRGVWFSESPFLPVCSNSHLTLMKLIPGGLKCCRLLGVHVWLRCLSLAASPPSPNLLSFPQAWGGVETRGLELREEPKARHEPKFQVGWCGM